MENAINILRNPIGFSLYPFGVYSVDWIWLGVVARISFCRVTPVIVQVPADSGDEIYVR
jgi:hypothetical protein